MDNLDQSDDATEAIRRSEQARINALQADREALEKAHGQVWDTNQLADDFEVLGFGAPLVVAVRKSDRVTGSLYFQHMPRFYWGFEIDGRNG